MLTTNYVGRFISPWSDAAVEHYRAATTMALDQTLMHEKKTVTKKLR
jgi:hypothetical protein